MQRIALLTIFFLFALFANGQERDSTAMQKRNQFVRLSIIPLTLAVAGLSTIDEDHWVNRFYVRAERNEDIPYFRHHVDDYLQYAPLLSVYALNAFGVKGKNEWKNRTALLIKSELLMTSIVFPIKIATHQIRPDSSNFHSFPSGHTAQAFAAATFLHKEFGGRSIWYSIGGYTVATAIATLRILNNKHWLSDVLVGAGIGIFSTNLVYHTHRYKWGKKPALTIVPTYQRGPGLFVAYKFK